MPLSPTGVNVITKTPVTPQQQFDSGLAAINPPNQNNSISYLVLAPEPLLCRRDQPPLRSTGLPVRILSHSEHPARFQGACAEANSRKVGQSDCAGTPMITCASVYVRSCEDGRIGPQDGFRRFTSANAHGRGFEELQDAAHSTDGVCS